MIDSPFISVTRFWIPPFAVGMRAFYSKGLFSTRGTERRRSKQCVDSGEARSAGTRLLGRYRADSFKAEHLSHYTSGRRRMPHIFTVPTRRVGEPRYDPSRYSTRVVLPHLYRVSSLFPNLDDGPHTRTSQPYQYGARCVPHPEIGGGVVIFVEYRALRPVVPWWIYMGSSEVPSGW